MQNEDPVLKKENEKRESMEKTYFFLRNLIKGLIWLGIIVGGYFYLEANYDITLEGILGPLYENTAAIYSLFLFSEVVFGLIPPELFMIWSLKEESLTYYIQNVIALSAVSYLAGMIGYYFGSKFSYTKLYKTIQARYIGKYEIYFNKFGGFLIVVAALTPVPYSGVCMLMGAVKYDFKMFLLICISRFLRFFAYAWVVWEANILQ